MESGFAPASSTREALMAHQKFYCDPTSNGCCPANGITPAPSNCSAQAGCMAGDE